jgi:hypothetical protein
MKPTENQIKEIAELLDCGMQIFYHIKNGEIKEIPDFIDEIDSSENPWNNDLDVIYENRNDYFEFKAMSSYDSYQIMVDFTENVENEIVQHKLLKSLNRSKPFRHFKQQIENTEKYLEKWYVFKEQHYIQWVKNQIERNRELF